MKIYLFGAVMPIVAGLLTGCEDGTSPAVRDGAGAARQSNPAAVQHRGTRPSEELSNRLAAQIPGFGGVFLEEGRYLVLWVTDLPRQERKAHEIARATFGSWRWSGHLPGSPTIAVRQGQFTWNQLSAWRDRVEHLLPNVPDITSVDLEERRNRVVIGIAKRSTRAAVLRKLAEAGVPVEATILEEEPIMMSSTDEEAADTVWDDPAAGSGSCSTSSSEISASCISVGNHLHDMVRPIVGGLRIEWQNPYRNASDHCTLGFTVRMLNHPDQFGFITNSHCTGEQGGVHNRVFGQPYNYDPYRIGVEVIDPPYQKDWWDPNFYRGTDAAVAFVYANVDGYDQGFGRIAKPTTWGTNGVEPGPLEIDPNQRTLPILRERAPIEGDVVDKIGQRSGWTYGAIRQVCKTRRQYIGYVPRYNRHTCETEAKLTNEFGDSGSPVFYWIWDGEIHLMGILHTRSSSIFGTYGWWSPLSDMRVELGDFQTYPGGPYF
ncbi:MAG: S1 family peptidase [Chloroflexota bacterium]|nr:S1 family peptidase [Chloroflexota bacterium]